MMKTKTTLKNLVTLLLFASFLLAYFLDLTGLALHQWLGIAAAATAALHLIMHWQWVKAVTERFFGRTSGQARSFYLLDILLGSGLATITLTGMLISSWFNLAVSTYEFWRVAHVAASVVTMAALALKLALHWKCIAAMFKPTRVPRLVTSRPFAAAFCRPDPKLVSRREALRVISTVSAVGLVGILRAASALRTVEAAALPQPALNTQASISAEPTASSQGSIPCPANCSTRCRSLPPSANCRRPVSQPVACSLCSALRQGLFLPRPLPALHRCQQQPALRPGGMPAGIGSFPLFLSNARRCKFAAHLV